MSDHWDQRGHLQGIIDRLRRQCQKTEEKVELFANAPHSEATIIGRQNAEFEFCKAKDALKRAQAKMTRFLARSASLSAPALPSAAGSAESDPDDRPSREELRRRRAQYFSAKFTETRALEPRVSLRTEAPS